MFFVDSSNLIILPEKQKRHDKTAEKCLFCGTRRGKFFAIARVFLYYSITVEKKQVYTTDRAFWCTRLESRLWRRAPLDNYQLSILP